MKVIVCIGSSCHIKGSRQVVEKLQSLISIYGAKIIDRTGGCIVAELTDTPQRLDGFIEDTAKFNVIESCRSGAIAMERGNVDYEL